MSPQKALAALNLEPLGRDHVRYGDFTLLLCEHDGGVAFISDQAAGESPRGAVSIPRHVFDKFIRWYQTGDADMRKR
jgi:hypothetical protein